MSLSASTNRSAARGAPDKPEIPSELDVPSGTPHEDAPDWGRVGALAAGIVIGAVIGAGAALLLAPQSGPETRKSVSRAARRGRERASEAWDQAGDQLWWMARRGKKRMRRRAARTGWAIEDLLDNIVGPVRGHGRPPRSRETDEERGGGRIVIEEE